MKHNQSNIKIAKKYLDKNNCVGIPTETVYGLAGNAYSDIAVKKIFSLKKRPKNNPLIVHYHSLFQLENDCVLNRDFFLLYKKFCPGPLTFVLKLKKKSKISKFVTNNKNTLAIRFPKQKLVRKLIKSLDYPLAAPSANISTKLSSVNASDVKEEFGKKVKFVLDGGKCEIGIESTIINLTKKPEILRLGGLENSKIKKIIGKKLTININPFKKNAPGQSKLHYSPGIPLRMNALKSKKGEAFISLKKKNNKNKNFFYLSKKGKLNDAAKNLYSILRKIKKRGYKSIAIQKIKNIGIGKTINDRLYRASNK
jgi:L-threonylcarbamoyladenylate synthase